MIQLGPFELFERAGEGAMAEVWRARHRAQNHPVAVKIVTGSIAQDALFRRRFAEEVRAVARLHHTGIVQLVDYGELPESILDAGLEGLRPTAPYLVMEWVEGGTLRPLLGRMRWSQLRPVLLSLLDALSSAHANELVHRDLKPDNVLMSKRGPVLSDFGVAFAADSQEVMVGDHTMVGTPNYMAPEQILGDWRIFGPWTDLYALGCLTYALICGRAPYAGPKFAQVINSHLKAPIPRLVPALTMPEGIENWVYRLMSKAPGDRFQLAADAAIALLDYPEHVTESGEERLELEEFDSLDETIVTPQVFVPVSDVSWAYGARRGDRPGLPSTWRIPEVARPLPPLAGVGRSLFGLAQTPLFGRENERDFLWEKLGRLSTGHGVQVVFVRGPAGQGKSALVRWIARRAQEVGAAIPLTITHQKPNGPSCGLTGLIERSMKADGLPQRELRSRIESICESGGISRLSGVLSDMASAQGTGLNHLNQSVIYSSDERFEAVCNYLHVLTKERPRILIVDDVQWGSNCLRFTEYLVNRWGHLPILVLATIQEVAGQIPGSIASQVNAFIQSQKGDVMVLGPLGSTAHRALLASTLSLDDEVSNQLAERSGGNPLFTREIIQNWITKGVLIPGPRGFRLRASGNLPLPDGIRSLWLSRVNAALHDLPGAARLVLDVASVLGQTVRQDELEGVCAYVRVHLDPSWIERFFDARLIEPAGSGRWSFAHALLRETLQDTARLEGDWGRWHDGCAEVLRSRVDVAPERLGEHFLAAGRYEEALEPFLRSADYLRFSSDYDASRGRLLRAVKALKAMNAPRDGRQWAAIRWRWAICARVRGDFGSAFRQARRVRDVAERTGEQELFARSLLELGRSIDTVQDAQFAIPYFLEAVQAAQRSGSSEMHVNCLNALARAYRSVSDFTRSRAIYEQAIKSCDPERYPMIYGTSLLGLARLEVFADRPDLGVKLAREANLRFTDAGSRWALAQSLNVIGDAERFLGNQTQAEAAYRVASDILHAIGSIDAPYGDANLAIALMEQRRWLDAAERISIAVEGAKRIGSRKSQLLISAVALLTDARTHSWDAWDERTVLLQPMIEGTLADLDVATSALEAARYGDSVGETQRADFAWTLAIRQFELLGKDGQADTARREWAEKRYG